MKISIITHTLHKQKGGLLYAYEPYIREINLWIKNIDKTKIVAPFSSEGILPIESHYVSKDIGLIKIPKFNILNFIEIFKSFFKIPYILFKIYKAMAWSDHIHLRCPGNVGLLGSFVQILFSSKPKTVKYAGNWDPNSKQPFSYCLQKWVLTNTFLTKNCKILVYGNWKNQSKNVISFFTASYSKSEIEKLPKKTITKPLKIIYVGTFTKEKQPLKSVKVVENLHKKGQNVELNMFGNGNEFNTVRRYLTREKLNSIVTLHGNKSKEIIKKAFQESHFLVFISKSEGWPKVISEAMFWSCLPISSKISCVPYMLDYGKRGILVNGDVSEIVMKIEAYLKDLKSYTEAIERAKDWSQGFTLETFEKAIKRLI